MEGPRAADAAVPEAHKLLGAPAGHRRSRTIIVVVGVALKGPFFSAGVVAVEGAVGEAAVAEAVTTEVAEAVAARLRTTIRIAEAEAEAEAVLRS
jgi:hypothetical protein